MVWVVFERSRTEIARHLLLCMPLFCSNQWSGSKDGLPLQHPTRDTDAIRPSITDSPICGEARASRGPELEPCLRARAVFLLFLAPWSCSAFLGVLDADVLNSCQTRFSRLRVVVSALLHVPSPSDEEKKAPSQGRYRKQRRL